MNTRLIKEAKSFLVHDVAPTLMPTMRGLFQVRLRGLFRSHADIEVRMVNDTRAVVKSFGACVVPIGGAVIVDQFSSAWKIADNTPAVRAYFQAWLIGMNAEHTEAQISLRLVDERRNELVNFGSMVRRVGDTVTLNGMNVVATIMPRGH